MYIYVYTYTYIYIWVKVGLLLGPESSGKKRLERDGKKCNRRIPFVWFPVHSLLSVEKRECS